VSFIARMNAESTAQIAFGMMIGSAPSFTP
jgi:hypothetical protein